MQQDKRLTKKFIQVFPLRSYKKTRMNFLGHLIEWIILSHLQYLFVVELEYEPRWILLQNPWRLYCIQLVSIWHMVGVPSEKTKMGKCQRWAVCGEGKGNPLHVLAWRIPWAEEPGKL